MNIVIFGPPGAGKGTQSNLIVKKYKLYHLFEKNLTEATEYPTHPCMHQFDTKGGHYSVYTKTVTHGVPGLLAVTLDLWGEGR